MNRLDILVQVLSGVSKKDPLVLRRTLEAEAKKDPKVLRALCQKVSEEDAKNAIQTLGEGVGELNQWAEANPKEFLETLSQNRVTESMLSRERARYASHALAARRKRGNVKTTITRESFQRLGSIWWPHSFAKTKDPHDVAGAFQSMVEYVQEVKETPGNKDWVEENELALQTETVASYYLFCARWAHYAFPVVQLGSHKYAAALMATSVHREVSVKPPWGTFLIELPSGMLHTDATEAGGEVNDPLVFVMVSQHRIRREGSDILDGWSFDAHSKSGATLHRSRVTLDEMCADIPKESEDAYEAFSSVLDNRDDRTILLLTRLVLNVCLAMSNPENVRTIGNHPKSEPVGPPRNGSDPTCRVFRIGRPIVLDCRPALQEFLEGVKRNPLTVQFLVRGHWRWQACGTGRLDRRLTWIEPHWKGPEDASINLRDHVLKTTPSS